MSVFGPVPSRRLGRSLGINHIPLKACSYACVYCQLGRTIRMEAGRTAYSEPEELLAAVRRKIAVARERGERIDYITFVPDGEPTLDANLGRHIDLVRPLGIPVAVISNASLIWRPEVREELARADWVSLKVDAVQADVWRRIDRPHGALRLADIQDGMLAFAQAYGGALVTETMLVAGVNDGEEQVGEIAQFVARLNPATAYLAIPTRPPAEPWVQAPDEHALLRAYRIMGERVPRVEHLIGYEGNEFGSTGDVVEDLLAITAVHPMREDAVRQFLERAGAGWAVVHGLVRRRLLVEAEFGGHRFYVRKLR
ncbi:MAG: radical SAM protein [Anaerolineae bacterium]|nr:radical SAM protein [Anaerolineae bacterium]